MLIGAGGLAIIYGILGFGYYIHLTGPIMLILVLSAIACFAMTLGPMVWVIIAEIFPNRIRGAAVSIAVAALWIACTMLNFTFPLLNAAFGSHGTFWIYGIICVLSLALIFRYLPETKGKSLEEIESEVFQ
jgi:SP family sugar porter-like MFS transporter